MTVKIMGLVAVRLLALYFFLTGIISIIPTLWYFFRLIEGPHIPILDQTYGTMLLAGGVYIVLGMLIWCYAYLVSDRLVSEEQGSEKMVPSRTWTPAKDICERRRAGSGR